MKSGSSGTSPLLSVHSLLLDENHRIVVANRRLQKSFRVGRRRRHHDFQSRKVCVPRFDRLRVLRRNLKRRAARTTKNDRNIELTARHVKHLGGGVDDLIGGKDREVESHELDDRSQPGHRRADAEPGEAKLSDRRIDNSLAAKLVEQPFGNFVSAVVLGDFLAHQKNFFIAGQLFTEGLIKCFADRDCRHIRILFAAWFDWVGVNVCVEFFGIRAADSPRQNATSLRLLRAPCDRSRRALSGRRSFLRAGWRRKV